MSINLNQAARLTGKSKNTLLRAITSGKLTERRNENSTYAFDEEELVRVFPPTKGSAEVETLKAALDDMRKERDAWKAVAERLAEAMSKRE
jgi:hypothetical protein